MTKNLLVVLLLSLNLINSNQFENHNNNETTSAFLGFISCQSSFYCNKTELIGCCGTNCSNIRCCDSTDDYLENYFDNSECGAETVNIVDYNKKEFFVEFEENANRYIKRIYIRIIVLTLLYLLIIVSILVLLWICSFRYDKNECIYQYLANRYYFIYKLFSINNNNFGSFNDQNTDQDLNEESHDTSSSGGSNVSQNGFEINLLHKLYAKKNKSRHKLMEIKREEKFRIVNSLIDSGILIKFDEIGEKFDCKKFDNNFMTQKVLNLHQYMKKIKKS